MSPKTGVISTQKQLNKTVYTEACYQQQAVLLFMPGTKPSNTPTPETCLGAATERGWYKKCLGVRKDVITEARRPRKRKMTLCARSACKGNGALMSIRSGVGRDAKAKELGLMLPPWREHMRPQKAAGLQQGLKRTGRC